MGDNDTSHRISGYLPKFPRFWNLLRRRHRIFTNMWETILASFLLVAAVISGFATYAALRQAPPFGEDPQAIFWLFNIDLAILLVFLGLIGRRIYRIMSGRRKRLAGSSLHVRLVMFFAVLAITPAIVMVVFSTFFFHFGVQTWFSDRVKTAVEESREVAQAYLQEHYEVIRADILAMAHDLGRQAPLLADNQNAFQKLIQTQAKLRNLSEVVIFDSSGQIMARSGFTASLEVQQIPARAMNRARRGDVVLLTGPNEDRIRALVQLDNFKDSFLFVGRFVDPKVISHLEDTREAVNEYAELEARYPGMQITVTMIFIVVALILLMAAIWFGLVFARKLVAPIEKLVRASERVRSGDFGAQVQDNEGLEEFDYLARSFNRMTAQISEQRDELVAANRQLDQRRRFTETILAGVTSGIIGVDAAHTITLANSAAGELLEHGADELAGRNVREILPEISDLLDQAHARPSRIHQAEIGFYQRGKCENRVFLVRITIETLDGHDNGAVITLDDITELQNAQRKAAWSNVARRIAHEIKNPLTPIQLSAERLKRRYMYKLPEDDQKVFNQCTDTIIRHVNDIGRMVGEFSSFARMPEPRMQALEAGALIRESLALQQQAYGDIHFEFELADDHLETAKLKGDHDQLRQALTNTLQNAIDSIYARAEQQRQSNDNLASGQVRITLDRHPDDNQSLVIAIADNGQGFPQEDIGKLTEPYVTHRNKGTGLGLAIVRKIMEDHNGQILFGPQKFMTDLTAWYDIGGASVVMILPVTGSGAEYSDEAQQARTSNVS
jgi:two-component system nitrogen regulation sensor histidine kinase NtrY